jgi:ubiquinone/menaquinone biosynthesis C-methylase UbiE
MLYEDQAATFDERAAIPAEAGESVAAAVAEIAGLRQGDTLLEVGAGTGMLGLPLIGRPIRYIGFDRSPAMLAVFRKKLEEARLCAELLVADGNGRWPAEDGSVAAIFSARAIHLIDVNHAVAETARVLRPEEGWLILGRVHRPDNSVKPALRRQMRKLLEEEGYSGRDHDAHVEAIFSTLEAIGGERAASPNCGTLDAEARSARLDHGVAGEEGLRRLRYPGGSKGACAQPASYLGRGALWKPGNTARAGRVLRTRCDLCAYSMTSGSIHI